MKRFIVSAFVASTATFASAGEGGVNESFDPSVYAPKPKKKPGLINFYMSCNSAGCKISTVPLGKKSTPQKSKKQAKKDLKALSKLKKLAEFILNKLTKNNKAPKLVKKIRNRGAVEASYIYAKGAYNAHKNLESKIQHNAAPPTASRSMTEAQRAQQVIDHLDSTGRGF